MGKEELLRAANKANAEDKFEKFRRLTIELADTFVEEGVCNGYTLEDIKGGTIPLLTLDVRPLEYGQVSNEKYRVVAKRYFELMHSCGITDEEFERARGGFNLLCVPSRDDAEDKFAKFRRLVVKLADALVEEGVCNGYTLEDEEGGTMPLLTLDARPLKYGQVGNEKHRAVAKRYFDLMHSCGITDEEFEYAKGGFHWLCVSNRR